MANLFWVGGSTAYDGVTNRFATTTGGTATVAAVAAADTVTFDANSPAAAVVTTSAAISCTSLILNTGFTGSLTMSNALTTSTGTTLTQGTLDTNGQTCNLTTLSVTGTLTRTLSLGASIVNLGGTASNTFNASVITGLTFNPGTSTINFTATTSGQTTLLQGGGMTFYDVNFTGAGPIQVVSGTNTYHNLSKIGNATLNDSLALNANQTVTGTFTVTGNSTANRLLVYGLTVGTPRTITAAAVSASNVDFTDVTGAGAASWNLSAITGGSGDAGGNSGITFTPAVTRYWVADTGNWGDTAHWATSTGGAPGATAPLPQDTAILDANSLSAIGKTITWNMARLCADLDTSGLTKTVTIAYSSAISKTNYGSLTWNTNITASSWTTSFIMAGRGTHTLTSAGKTFPNTWIFNGTGSFTLQDNFAVTGQVSITAGTFDANGMTITGGTFSSAAPVVGTMIKWGSGIHTFSGSGTVINISTFPSGITNFLAQSSTIVLSNTTATAKTFVPGGNGVIWNNVTITGGGTGAILLSTTAGQTFNWSGVLTINGAKTFTWHAGTNYNGVAAQTVGTMAIVGSAGNVVTMNTDTPGTTANIRLGSGSNTAAFGAFQDIYASANMIDATNNGTDNGDNLGVIFTRTENRYEGMLGVGI